MLTLDAKGVLTRDAPVEAVTRHTGAWRWQAKMAQATYERQLRGVADQVGKFVQGANWASLAIAPQVQQVLADYASVIELWASSVAGGMIEAVERRNRTYWQQAVGESKGWRERFANSPWAQQSEAIGRALRNEIDTTAVGQRMKGILADQVTLIKSIPLDAAQRVHEWTLKGITEGMRYDDIVDGIMQSGEVARSRAVLIARTETARTSTALTQSRAEQMGCTHFTWRATKDGNTRPEHRALSGKIFAFNDPPVIANDRGREIRGLPGTVWNCRCWCEPLLPDLDD